MSQTRIDFKSYKLSTFADIAHSILNKDTDYLKSKNIILKIFNRKWGNRFETIKFRLTIIDNFYSTQMNKRFFGIDDLAETLKNYSDNDLRLKCEEYLEGDDKSNEIQNLFEYSYGIHKLGKDGGKAGSLISKYLYFLTNYKFPIYDSLVKISYKYIQNKYTHLNIPNMKSKFGKSYFENIKEFKKISKIDTYDKLDNLLWLIGKITNGSLSLILNKKRYLKLVSKLKIPDDKKDEDPNDLVKEHIRKNIDDLDFFNKDEIKFLKYSFALAENSIKNK